MKKSIVLFLLIVLIQFSCKKQEDLSSFAIMNNKIEESNDNQSIKIESFLEIVYVKSDKDFAFSEHKETAKRVHEIGLNLDKYLEDLKKVIKEKNTTEFVDELFFNGTDITTEGNEFLMYIENYKSSMLTALGVEYPQISAMINSTFSINNIEDRRGQTTNWLTLNYKGFPPISSVIKLSEMQSDIKRIETKFLAILLRVKLKESNRSALANNTTPIPTNTKDPVKKEIIKTPKKVKKQLKKEVPKKKITPKKLKPKKATKKYHTVKRGETVYRISVNYGITTSKLKKLNGMTNNNLVVGQKIRVK